MTRFWTLIHDGELCSMVWDDGERLLALSTEVRSGSAVPQDFTFTPRGAEHPGGDLTIGVRPDAPLDLITEYSTVISAMRDRRVPGKDIHSAS